jgi:hypothetical protein
MAATYYAQLLRAYQWERIAADCREAIAALRGSDNPRAAVPVERGLAAACIAENWQGAPVTYYAAVYLGRTYQDSPSGRFYAPWSTVPDSVRDQDARWYEALERAAEKHGLSIESGEGDPTDTYATLYEDADDAD